MGKSKKADKAKLIVQVPLEARYLERLQQEFPDADFPVCVTPEALQEEIGEADALIGASPLTAEILEGRAETALGGGDERGRRELAYRSARGARHRADELQRHRRAEHRRACAGDDARLRARAAAALPSAGPASVAERRYDPARLRVGRADARHHRHGRDRRPVGAEGARHRHDRPRCAASPGAQARLCRAVAWQRAVTGTARGGGPCLPLPAADERDQVHDRPRRTRPDEAHRLSLQHRPGRPRSIRRR